AIRRSSRCRRRPSGRPARPPPAAAPRTASEERPRRLPRPRAAGRRRRCGTAARRTPRAGCATRGPCTWSLAPSVVIPPGVGREIRGAAGGHLLIDLPALVDRLLREAPQAL